MDGVAHAGTERDGVSRVIAGDEMPFQPWTFRALAAPGAGAPLEAWVALVGRGGRIVLEGPQADAGERLERARTRLLLSRSDWIVALVETS